MSKYEKEPMNTILRLRMTKSDYLRIKERAKNNHLSVSDYLRRRGASDPDITESQEINQANTSKARFACDHDRELMRLVYRSYFYNKEMAKKEFGQEWFNEAEKIATLLMKEWKYE